MVTIQVVRFGGSEFRVGFWVERLIIRNHSEINREVKKNRLKNSIHRTVRNFSKVSLYMIDPIEAYRSLSLLWLDEISAFDLEEMPGIYR